MTMKKIMLVVLSVLLIDLLVFAVLPSIIGINVYVLLLLTVFHAILFLLLWKMEWNE